MTGIHPTIMSIWDHYPSDYRAQEVEAIGRAARSGESVSVVGLSGAGKSNLLGFLANRQPTDGVRYILVDGNRLADGSPAALFRLIRGALGDIESVSDEWAALDRAIQGHLRESGMILSVVLDRIDDLVSETRHLSLNQLRALRDAHKYDLVFVTGTRRPVPPESEFSELVLANTIWLGPLSESDSRWSIERYATRRGVDWDESCIQNLIRLSGSYPSMLRAACEALAAGSSIAAVAEHPAVQARIEEFWADTPDEAALRNSRIDFVPLLDRHRPHIWDSAELTAKEHLLLTYLRGRAGTVCDKESLIHAVWPEDQIYEEGVRDDSLAQLVRRLREKVEADPANPRQIETVRGRGYRFRAD